MNSKRWYDFRMRNEITVLLAVFMSASAYDYCQISPRNTLCLHPVTDEIT